MKMYQLFPRQICAKISGGQHDVKEGYYSQNNCAYSLLIEDKAKVVTSVWGAEFVQFLAALAVWKNRMNSTYSLK